MLRVAAGFAAILCLVFIQPQSLLAEPGDTSPPVFDGPVRDGTLANDDITVTFSSGTLAANWDPASDPESGISGYRFAVGTSPGAEDVVAWSDAGTAVRAVVHDLSLVQGTTYYFSVYAVNGEGQRSMTRSSNGQRAQRLPFRGIPLGTVPQQKSAAPMAPQAEGPLPSAVSNIQYLPVVGSQGTQGSCVAWSECYYQKTWQEARQHGWTRPNPAVDPEHVCSPAFAYNLLQGDVIGAERVTSEIAGLMTSHGCATWRDMPYNDKDALTWPSETAWRNAMAFKIGSRSIVYTSDPGGMLRIKEALAGGQLVGCVLPVYGNLYYDYPVDTAGINNGVYFAENGAVVGGHELTIIGYDDNMTYNDGTGVKSGAFLVVNSWGGGWGLTNQAAGSQGFMWISYEYAARGINYASILEDDAGDSGKIIGVFGLRHALRRDLQVFVEGGADENAPSWSLRCLDFQGGANPIDTRIAVDLTKFNPDTKEKFWLRVYDANAADPAGEIVSLAIEKEGHSWSCGDLPRTLAKEAFTTAAFSLPGGGDTSPPSAVGFVYDGPDGDRRWSVAADRIAASWGESADGESGIVCYWYAVGTTPGGTEIAGWTDNGASRSVEMMGLALVNGSAWYVSVKAENGAGLFSEPVVSNGITVEVTPPEKVAVVRDGPAEDLRFTVSTTGLAANWEQSSDAESGVLRYWYAVGSSSGTADIVPWTDNGPAVSFALPEQVLVAGKTYYVSVKAENGAGLSSEIAASDGISCEASPPGAVAWVHDGLGVNDIRFTSTTVQVSGNWAAAEDPESGIARYWYAVGTTPGAGDVVPWTDNGTALSFLREGVQLKEGKVYYVAVKAVNGAGWESTVAVSDGQTVNYSVPYLRYVYDGTDGDRDWSAARDSLSARWAGYSVNQGSIARYRYAVGIAPRGSDVVPWTDAGTATSFSLTGLALREGSTYYVSVKAENWLGLESDVVSSDGLGIDATPPKATVSIAQRQPLAAGTFDVAVAFDDLSGIAGTPLLAYTLADGTQVNVPLEGANLAWKGTSNVESYFANGTAQFVISAVDRAGNACRSVAEGGSFTIDTTVRNVSGGTTRNSDGTTIVVPAGACAEDVTIVVSAPDESESAIRQAFEYVRCSDKGIRTVAGANLCRRCVAIGGQSRAEITRFSLPVTVYLPYPDANRDGVVDGTSLRASSLKVFVLNEATGRWEQARDSKVELSSACVRISTDRLSTYTLMALVPAKGLAGVIAYPNPWRTARDPALSFGNIPPESEDVEVRIYTIAGELVRTLSGSAVRSEAGSKRAVWDGKNDNGEKIASGVYIYLIRAGGEKRTGRIGVIR